MDFIPYSRQNVSRADVASVCDALESEFLTQGPLVPAFESAFAEAHDCAHGVALNSATAGLHCALAALEVGPGAKVWTTPISFVASANCARYCGAEVDFVDIDPATRNLSVQALRDKLAATPRPQHPAAVVVVDFAGMPADLCEIRELADRHGFKLIEDASHATGASYRGRPVGSAFADATVYSFHAVKIITTGEGGMVLTNEAETSRRLQRLRTHGITRNPAEFESPSPGPWYYEQHSLGFNYRMTESQAALGLSQLQRLAEMRTCRAALARRYDEALADLPIKLPRRQVDRESAWHLYVVEIDETRTGVTRAEVFERMRNHGIGVNVHYIPIHLQPYYRKLGFHRGQFPASERYYDRAISIPLFPTLTEPEQQRVIDALRASLEPQLMTPRQENP